MLKIKDIEDMVFVVYFCTLIVNKSLRISLTIDNKMQDVIPISNKGNTNNLSTICQKY